ncbi:PLP-dependent aminotransferase family protein [Achromobacter sp. GG226]|uniref:aminotransferase-like domain-containing protein n=1 Tax=Verticiella alkaliphila TaxID=2779529 RepID=UPI001C0BAA89|nr:PLP-dependent aminotransferase family protein [Verticiella sp. GG226]MBU4611559.1 PLP-dependent aminotransferase family protein [Verticiella sp. GG226]
MSRVNDIVAGIAARIERGDLRPAERLPSVRAGAAAHGVSKNTLAEAYDRLVALGLLEARPGSGYYVGQARHASAQPVAPHVVEAIDTVSLLREQLVQHYAVRVGDGRAPPAWMARFDLPRPSAAGRAADVELEHGYGNPWGNAPLRDRLAQTLAERGITAGIEQILLTHGANHALDLVARQLLQPGDVVLVDTPGYYPLFGKLRLSNVRVVGVRRLPDGPDVEDLAAKVAAFKPKVFFTQSLAHNPTGGSLTLPVAHRVLRVATEAGMYIVEDDPFADILPSTSPRLATLDQLERVVYVGTFSKTLSASLRVGYVAGAPALMKTLCDLKMLTVVSTSDFVERLVFNLMARGQYLRHVRRLRGHVERAQRDAANALEGLGLTLSHVGGGGFYLWVELAPHIDELALVRAAARESVFLAPGSVFRTERVDQPPALRVNVAYANDPRFVDFMRRHAGGRAPR